MTIDPAQLIAFALGLLIFTAVDDLLTSLIHPCSCTCTCGEDEDEDTTPGEDGHV